MTAPTFEQTYIKYPFAPLVRLALKISAFLIAHTKHKDSDTDMPKGMPHSA